MSALNERVARLAKMAVPTAIATFLVWVVFPDLLCMLLIGVVISAIFWSVPFTPGTIVGLLLLRGKRGKHDDR